VKAFLLPGEVNLDHMRKENHLLTNPVLPFNNHYTAKSNYSCYPSFGIVRPMAGKGLVQSIQLLVDDARFTTSIGVSFKHEGPIETIDEAKKTALLRIVQEQLNNVIKYSPAIEVLVSLSVEKESMQLSVKDNGIGFDVNRTRNGIGLSNIYGRVASHKGTMQLQTSKGQRLCIISSNTSEPDSILKPPHNGKDHHPHC
jgi:hypothetical protein